MIFSEDTLQTLLQCLFLICVILVIWIYETSLWLYRTRLPDWLEDVRLWNELEHQALLKRLRKKSVTHRSRRRKVKGRTLLSLPYAPPPSKGYYG